LKCTCCDEVAVNNLTGMATRPNEIVAEEMARAGMVVCYRTAPPLTKSSADDLEDYRDKRDPRRTNEPFGAERINRSRETWRGDFVVHQHGARRMHFDLRLEMAGTLTSFAVPKGPSLDPADKRLAVQTEDHPLEYLDFEDVIPEGNYGAGPMIVWDIGRVQYLEQAAEVGEQKGKLDFLLLGHKLQGRFALVLTGKGKPDERGQRQWLLLKKPDLHARPGPGEALLEQQPHSVLSGLTLEQLGQRTDIAEALEQQARALGAPLGNVPASELVPMLCSTRGGELRQKGRIYELKLDGVRIVTQKQSDSVSLRYRSLRPAATNYPEVVRAVRALAPARLVLDGEIVAFNDQGRPSFQRLAPRIHARQAADIAQARSNVPVQYIVFDLLQLGPYDLRSLSLLERKRLLRQLLPGRGVIWMLDHVADDGQHLFDWCRQQRLEGVVSKLAAGPYREGPSRTQDWIKIKCGQRDEFVVVGWVTGKNSRERLGALELASWDGATWVYRGRVGSGLAESAIDELLARLEPLRRVDDPALGEPLPYQGERIHVEPELVVSVEYLEWTPDRRLRMAVFCGIREDIEPRSCQAAPHDSPSRDELPAIAPEPEPEPEHGAHALTQVLPKDRGPRVQLTNQDKVFWPDEGHTKGDLLEYYAAISDTLLPHLKDRPVMLVRYPDGIAGKNFYQWNVPRGTPDWIRTLALRDEERDGKTVATFLVDSADALLHIVNLGCIPLHVLACRQQTLDCCDFLTVDFDLGEQPLHQGVKLALSLRELLDELQLTGYPKTSGQTGLHVLIPLGPGISFDTAKALVELIGRLLQLRHSDVATMERRVSERRGRMYIDTGQTGRSRTIVAPYSVRAYPGASVSAPLYWEEVHMALDPRQLTMFTVPGRVLERGDPMQGLLAAKPDIMAAVARLGTLLSPLR
jgi:bifunctional non-homologous end joining protein LigD